MTDPFSQRLDAALVLRLLSLGRKGSKRWPDAKDRAKYEKTEHFKRLTKVTIALYGSCVLCDRKEKLCPHHRHYLTLFHEDIHKDVTLMCRRCHGNYHRGSRR